MLYTVKDLSALAGVTVKTLHHYHHIGLLPPCSTTEAGYRLYGPEELERLQEILFYKELDFPLDDIKALLERKKDRATLLAGQKKLFLRRIKRMERLLQTLDHTITSVKDGAVMEPKDLFEGFKSEAEWKEALAEQQAYLKDQYGYDLLEGSPPLQVEEMNEDAAEASRFMGGMAGALRDGAKHDSDRVAELIRDHLDYGARRGQPMNTPAEFAGVMRFFLQDDFHRGMLEAQQTGLSYYLCLAAEAYAAR
ncbi:MerR family transcriptional regulator [Gorillibacterium sp. sgz5001074]|uniref:MerR family transcriptional regulator n=1 Tax=Gorillibacterium sp. sgz5001074 TaxID=3446695 RepID=UPI003F668043